tara:strand:- start:2478 stop:2735 length:258 start_codon:yes stop_codon:yes gene_type:complete
MTIKKYIFEMDFSTTERCEVIAESEEEAVDLMLSGDFSDDSSKEWEEVKSQGGDWELISVSDEEESKGFYGYKQKTDNYYPELDD